MMHYNAITSWTFLLIAVAIGGAVPGCGTTKSVTATEQLLMSDAVDSTISKMDFRPLAGYKVFLDTTYIGQAGKPIPGVPMAANLVTSDYVISALRQQLTAAGCMLVDTKDTAEIICEARCGALGTDGHNVTYGLPANNFLNSATLLVPNSPPLPAIPELSVAKREVKSAAAKVAVFAYDRETREPLWQSGVAQAGSNARDTWILGIGPIQYGSIYRGTRFAGSRIETPSPQGYDAMVMDTENGVDHRTQHVFANQLFSGNPDSQPLVADRAIESTPETEGQSPKAVQAKLNDDTLRR
jgi:hypothetical protein